MPFLNIKFSSVVVLVVFALSSFFSIAYAEEEVKAKAETVVGEVKHQKKSKGVWHPLKVGGLVKHQDALQTFAGAKVDLSLENGSRITIEENSIVGMTQLIAQGKVSNTKIQIKKGSLLFDVKKMASSESQFEFVTNKATAAIRGTAGGVGESQDGFFAYLDHGALDVKGKEGGGITIHNRELLVMDHKSKSFKVMKISNGEDIKKVFTQFVKSLNDTQKTTVIPKVEDLLQNLQTQLGPQGMQLVDSIPVVNSQNSDLKLEVLEPSRRADISTKQMTISGAATPGVKIEIEGKSVIANAQGKWEISLKTPENSGTFKMKLKATLGDKSENLELEYNRVNNERKSNSLSGSVLSYPTQIDVAQIKVSGTCSDSSTVKIGDYKTLSVQGQWQILIQWPETEEGDKQWDVLCSRGEQEIVIGAVKTKYKKAIVKSELNLLTPSQVTVKEGFLAIQGNYVGKNPKLKLIYDGKETDITSASGAFSVKIPVLDKDKSWDLEAVSLRLSAEGVEDINKDVRVIADKTSKLVNTLFPSLDVLMDEANHLINVNVGRVLGDKVTLRCKVDGTVVQEIESESDLRSIKFLLDPGVHNYDIEVKDLALNTEIHRFNKISYWPKVEFKVELNNSSKGTVFRIPPAPPGVVEDLYQTFTVSLRNLPEDDYRYIQSLQIENSANGFKRLLLESQITSTDLDFEVPISRILPNVVTVKVTPKVGPLREVTQTVRVAR